MNYIIFDLEATCWENTPKSKTQETIEIGAIFLNAYGEIEGSFNRFIRPVLNPYLSNYCMSLTTIRQEQVDRAEKFVPVIEDFQDWACVFDEDYVLCSWGDFDQEILINDCKFHDVEQDWLKHHINLKRQYQKIKGLNKQKGLKSAVTAEGFEFTGTHHRAIDDAKNLTKIFLKHLDMWSV
ncbi:MAG: exonuclease domain-containing protein [Saprospiraceae bacterium]|nr:exonuclease domain-containing protein [Saprospiraceae bacterium]